jgi:hypothetical protein
MTRNNFIKYYRVFKNDTLVTEVSANDFMPLDALRFKAGWLAANPVDPLATVEPAYYRLPEDSSMFYGYTNEFIAMRRAKSGALAYLEVMIKEVERGIFKLKQYRSAHYESLNVVLLDANIRRLEDEMNIK